MGSEKFGIEAKSQESSIREGEEVEEGMGGINGDGRRPDLQ